jgi:hypothetical protein
MSNQYPGGIITKNPATPTGPYDSGAAPGIWTITQQAGYKQQGVWPTAGLSANYIEDVFSTYLYTGNGTTQTITNGINLSTYGGLVWSKNTSGSTGAHVLYDTARGPLRGISTTSSSAEQVAGAGYELTAFNSNGFNLGPNYTYEPNAVKNHVAWTFREQAKFFDIVTYTGNGIAGRTVAHNLGSAPGFFVIKRLDASGDWRAYHRSLGADKFIYLNDASAALTSSDIWNNTAPTSTVFTLGNANSQNTNGATYVAYLFAHDAGGFGLTGTDNVISCGSYTGNSSSTGPVVTLGYEPQWLLIKKATASGTDRAWWLTDNMRGFVVGSGDTFLFPNTLAIDSTGWDFVNPTATGFNITTTDDNFNTSGITYIYIAIRRGPMAVPTTGTSVFAPVTGNFTSPYTVTTNFPVDLTISSRTVGATRAVNDRLRGGTTNSYAYLNTATDDAELTGTGAGLGFQSNTAVIDTNWQTGGDALWWNFKRAPSFFDEVCYSGTGSVTNVSHNLQAVPELMIVKSRSAANFWRVYSSAIGNTKILILSTDDAPLTSTTTWNSTTPTSSVFTLGTDGQANGSGQNFVNYLFATCPGVSKVGSYTGTGATQTINCGFGAGGARFALIKRTDSTGDWWVWDSARGMVAGTDPRIDLNAGNPQTNANWVYTISTGFQIVTTDASVNASGGTYIFLAIA